MHERERLVLEGVVREGTTHVVRKASGGCQCSTQVGQVDEDVRVHLGVWAGGAGVMGVMRIMGMLGVVGKGVGRRIP